MDLNRITTFVRVVDSGSFTAAARALGLPPSSVSRSVARLEDELGLRLLQRTTRTLGLTDAGRRYYDGVRGALMAVEEAGAAASESSSEPQGRVRLTVPSDFGGRFLMQALGTFAERYPRVAIDLLLTNRRVNLVEEGVDLALRAGQLDDSALMARKLGETELGLFASPAYLARRGTPRTLAALARHDCVLFRSSGGVVAWRLAGPRGLEEVKVTGRLTVDGMNALREAVLAGFGIGLLPAVEMPGEPLAPLVRVLPRHALTGGALHLLWPSTRYVPRHVALLRDFLVETLSVIWRR